MENDRFDATRHEKVAKILERYANLVCGYDIKNQENPLKKFIPPIILLYGQPRAGLSDLVEEFATQSKENAKRLDMPFHYSKIDKIDDVVWFDESGWLIKEKMAYVKGLDGVGLLTILNIDQFLMPRKNTLSLLNEIYKLKDGYKGNYLIIFTSNNADMIDPAIASRIKMKIRI